MSGVAAPDQRGKRSCDCIEYWIENDGDAPKPETKSLGCESIKTPLSWLCSKFKTKWKWLLKIWGYQFGRWLLLTVWLWNGGTTKQEQCHHSVPCPMSHNGHNQMWSIMSCDSNCTVENGDCMCPIQEHEHDPIISHGIDSLLQWCLEYEQNDQHTGQECRDHGYLMQNEAKLMDPREDFVHFFGRIC